MTDTYRERLNEYRELLASCAPRSCEGVFQRVADQFENDLLEFEEFPEHYFDFVVAVLSDAAFYEKAGVWNFLMVLGTEQGKLQPPHYQKLAELFIRKYGEYKNTDLCLSVCDFVARNYPVSTATKIFIQLADIESKKARELHGFVKDGLRILEAEQQRAELRRH